MAKLEKESRFYPTSDVDAHMMAVKLAPYISPHDYAFITPTATGLKKSIMDATYSVREFFYEFGLHDYEKQELGPDNKVTLKAFFVDEEGFTETKVTLYRPLTKHGDPRIWFSGLKKYATPNNLLMLTIIEGAIFVINLSKKSIWKSLLSNGIVYGTIKRAVHEAQSVKEELIELLKGIKNQGWLESITPGDPGVGDTLENALGIHRNASKLPDYKGIEIKTTRLSKDGKKRTPTRNTLFTETPDDGLTYHEILNKYGKVQVPKKGTKARLQIYETCSAVRVNAYDLYLECNPNESKVYLKHSARRKLNDPSSDIVSSWDYDTLKRRLQEKHPETVWIGAESKLVNGREYFRYTAGQYTNKPNASALPELIQNGIITMDLAAHETNGKYKDHGMLWKIKPKNRALIVGTVENIVLD